MLGVECSKKNKIEIYSFIKKKPNTDFFFRIKEYKFQSTLEQELPNREIKNLTILQKA